MTLDDWLDCPDTLSLSLELSIYPDRKLHLLTAALLRRAWNGLPSDHTRFAVEATEKFADGRITADALAWARSQAARESAEWVWLAQASPDDYNMLLGPDWCPCCAPRRAQYECHVAKQGGVLDGVRRGVDNPAWVAAATANWMLAAECPGAERNWQSAAGRWARQSLFATVREILSEELPDPRWPEWRTTDVVALARGIYSARAFDGLPILADALQEAGCDDESVLWHCRRPGGHVRGCWVIDLALGVV